MNSAFVSSMMRDYAPEREAARAGIEGAGWLAVMADHATASPDPAKTALLELVAQSDAVILLLGAQYGVPGESGFSPTEDEYRHALALDKPVFAFVQEGVNWEPDQEDFIARVRGSWETGVLTMPFRTADDLTLAVGRTLNETRTSPSVAGRWEHARQRVLRRRGWIDTLRTIYGPLGHDLVEFFGAPVPVCAFPADQEERDSLNAALGQLDTSSPLPGHGEYSREFDERGRAEFDYHCSTAVPGRKWNGASFTFREMRFENGRPRIDCRLGRYFQSLASSEICDTELMKALIGHPDYAVDLAKLPRRAWIHERTPDPVTNGAGRAAAVSVAMVIMAAAPGGGYLILMNPRSDDVATHPLFNHVAPSGIFAPLDRDVVPATAEFSVERNLLREYVEELYSIEELEIGTQPFHDLEHEPEIVRLRELIAKGAASLYYTGVTVNLLTLRPEICALLLVLDSEWIREETRAANECGRPWKLGWEWLDARHEGRLPHERRHQQWVRLTPELEPDGDAHRAIAVDVLIPNAAGAIHLARRVVLEQNSN